MNAKAPEPKTCRRDRVRTVTACVTAARMALRTATAFWTCTCDRTCRNSRLRHCTLDSDDTINVWPMLCAAGQHQLDNWLRHSGGRHGCGHVAVRRRLALLHPCGANREVLRLWQREMSSMRWSACITMMAGSDCSCCVGVFSWETFIPSGSAHSPAPGWHV